MTWRVIVESPRPSDPAIVVSTHPVKEDAERAARRIAAQYRFAGERRPKVYAQRADSRDQLQSYAHGTKAARDQPDLPAHGQDVVILVPPATAGAKALPPGG